MKEPELPDPWPRRLLWVAITALLILYLVCLLVGGAGCGDDCFVVDEKCVVVTVDDAVQAIPVDGGVHD